MCLRASGHDPAESSLLVSSNSLCASYTKGWLAGCQLIVPNEAHECSLQWPRPPMSWENAGLSLVDGSGSLRACSFPTSTGQLYLLGLLEASFSSASGHEGAHDLLVSSNKRHPSFTLGELAVSSTSHVLAHERACSACDVRADVAGQLWLHRRDVKLTSLLVSYSQLSQLNLWGHLKVLRSAPPRGMRKLTTCSPAYTRSEAVPLAGELGVS